MKTQLTADEEAAKSEARRVWRKKQRKAIERKTLGSGLNAGNTGADDVIKPALPAQTHVPIAIHFAFASGAVVFSDCSPR